MIGINITDKRIRTYNTFVYFADQLDLDYTSSTTGAAYGFLEMLAGPVKRQLSLIDFTKYFKLNTQLKIDDDTKDFDDDFVKDYIFPEGLWVDEDERKYVFYNIINLPDLNGEFSNSPCFTWVSTLTIKTDYDDKVTTWKIRIKKDSGSSDDVTNEIRVYYDHEHKVVGAHTYINVNLVLSLRKCLQLLNKS